jgi:hypothetical protein
MASEPPFGGDLGDHGLGIGGPMPGVPGYYQGAPQGFPSRRPYHAPWP